MHEMFEAVRDLTAEEFMRLARVLYEEGQNRSLGDPSDREFKGNLLARLTTWLEI